MVNVVRKIAGNAAKTPPTNGLANSLHSTAVAITAPLNTARVANCTHEKRMRFPRCSATRSTDCRKTKLAARNVA